MADTDRIIYRNLWQIGDLGTVTSEHPQFPAVDLETDTLSQFWRSRYGSGSGAGLFRIRDDGIAIATMAFDSGSVEPQPGELLTGATSGATADVIAVTLSTGTWAGGNAAGTITLRLCVGRFHDNETITGSVGGADILTVNEPNSAAGVDLVQNGEFSVDTDPPPGWTAGQSAVLTTEAGGQAGNCLMVENGDNSWGLGYQSIATEIGKFYRATVWFKKGTAAAGYIKIGTAIGSITYGSVIPVDAAWTEYAWVFKATTTTTFITVLSGSATITQTSYYDEISLYELEEPPNNKIDFQETAATPLVATLTAGDYNGHTLATEIKTQLDAAGASTYTVTYSDTTNKFTLVSDLVGGGNIFTLLWLTGANRGASAANTLGYSDAADDSGTDTYVSDSRRIHWPYEEIPRDLLTAYQYNHIALLGHNFLSSAIIKIIGADDAAFTTNVVSDTITYNANNIYFYLAAARTKRYIKIQVADPENSAGYLQLSVPYLGNYWEPSRKHGSEYGYGMDEISEGEESDSRTYYGTGSKPRLSTYYFDYQNIDVASRVNALDLMDECGIEKAFIFCEDYDNPNSGSYYVQNIELFEARGTIKDRCNWALSVKEVV